MHRHRPRALGRLKRAPRMLIVASALSVLAGCGSSASSPGSSADPAGVVPASAPLYASAVVRPSGTLKSSATSAAAALTHQPGSYARLAAALQLPGSPPLTYSHDIAPWLGTDAGMFLSSLPSSASGAAQLQQLLAQVFQAGPARTSAWPFSAPGVQGAFVLDTGDGAKAASFLSSEARHARAHAASYRGVAYQATSGGEAFGTVDRLLVLGTVTGLHSVIDTSLGGPALVHASDYSKLLASAPSGALAHVYSKPAGASAAQPAGSGVSSPGSGESSAPGGGASGPGAQGVGSLLGLLGGARTMNVSLVPTASSIALDADSLLAGSSPAAGGGGLAASASEGAKALSELPGDSWLAAGLGNAGVTLAGDVQALHGLATFLTSLGNGSATGAPAGESAGAFNIKGVLEAVLEPLSALSAPGAQSRHDFLSWMSSAGIFASGTDVASLRAAIVLGSTNPTLSRAAVAKLGAALEKNGSSVQSVPIPGADAAISAHVNGLPVEIEIADGRAADGQSKFVIGLSEASVQDALKPSSTLASSASSSVAASTLGEGTHPSLVIDFNPLLSLLEGVGLGEDPSISKALPYLHSLTTLVGGAKMLGSGIERYRLVAGLQQSG